MKKGYYIVKHYNYNSKKINFFNGERFENFKSDRYTHDEIEWYKAIDQERLQSGELATSPNSRYATALEVFREFLNSTDGEVRGAYQAWCRERLNT